MKQRRRIYYSAAQRSEIWYLGSPAGWEPMSAIGRRFDREFSSVFSEDLANGRNSSSRSPPFQEDAQSF
jgi:hypothetical protein